MNEFDGGLWQKPIQDTVAQLCQGLTQTSPLLGELLRLNEEADRYLDEQQDCDRGKIACKAGCGSCCVVNVSILLPEGLAIVGYIQGMAEDEQEKIKASLDDLWQVVRGLDEEDRLYLRRNCAFLDSDGCCRIYPVRPILCRSVSSVDPEQCRQALTAQVFGESSPLLMNLQQNNLYEGLFVGFANGLEQGGVDGNSFQLTGLVRYLLRNSQAEERFLRGGKVQWLELK